jgi:predicted nucleic acid-binding protein
MVVASRVTVAEVSRVMSRLRSLEPKVAAKVAAREAAFLAETERWGIHPVDESVWVRSGRPFPIEPVRMLDAIHLATIERLSTALPDLTVVSTDDRVRRNATALGFAVFP